MTQPTVSFQSVSPPLEEQARQVVEIVSEGRRNETRTSFIAPLHDVEWRKAGQDGAEMTFTGSAIVYNSWSEPMHTPLGSFRERIMPGAFDDVLAAGPDVRLLKNHDPNFVLARTKSGTLEKFSSDEDALRVWARVAPTSYALDLRMAMERGDLDQMSFAFMLDEDDEGADRWYEDEDSGEIRRDIVRASGLVDVSPVTYPAYVKTTAAMRELELRTAIERGDVAARAETDPVGEQAPDPSAEAETDPPAEVEEDASAEAETDPPADGDDPEAAEAAERTLAVQEAKESMIRLRKELAR